MRISLQHGQNEFQVLSRSSSSKEVVKATGKTGLDDSSGRKEAGHLSKNSSASLASQEAANREEKIPIYVIEVAM